jgi:hypothetical protein
MIIFLNILKSKFYISKFSSNLPKFFGYERKEIAGSLLKDLLPSEIKRDHDRYILDFVNQKVSPIIKTATLTSFAITKTGALKVVSVIVKLEYYMTDDIYLCGIIIPHPRNKDRLILSNMNGKIIALNNKAKELVGTKVVENPYSLFLTIPLLMKYFYPDIEDHLRYKKFSQKIATTRKKMSKDMKNLGQNFQLETENFGAFFFTYFLDEKFRLKGLVKKNKEGILNNFGFTDLEKWKGLQNLNRKMLIPKHLRILTRVISKNRELIQQSADKIMKGQITVETYKHRGNLTFKLIVLSDVKATTKKVQKFFMRACNKLQGEISDVMMVHPNDINNLCK